jgi:hypothetical protein
MDKKSALKKGLYFLFNSDYRFLILSSYGVYKNMPDEEYLKRLYKIKLGKDPDFKNPKTFNEKLQWLKMHYRRPDYTMMADKYAVRPYIAEKIGEEYLVPLLGVWDDPDDIDFDKLPDQFVLKCNHNSGLGMCICKDKSKLDVEKARKNIKKGFNEDYFVATREWQYKDIPRKIIAEKYLKDSQQNEETGIINYKINCFNGEPKYIYVSRNSDGKKNDCLSLLTPDWKDAPFTHKRYKPFDVLPPKPVNYDKMLEFSKILSEGIPCVRVDFYEIDSKLYFSELTFTIAGGFTQYDPPESGELIGSWLTLPEKWEEV